MDNYGKRGNCLRGVDCGPSSEWECCREKDQGGANGNHGTCCKSGTCLKSGHCKPAGTSITPKEPFLYEGYTGNNGNCNNWKWAFCILALITLILAFGFIVVGVKLRTSNGIGKS